MKLRFIAASAAFATGFLALIFAALAVAFSAAAPMLGASQKGVSLSPGLEAAIALLVGIAGIWAGLSLSHEQRKNAFQCGCVVALAIPFVIWLCAQLF